MPCSRALKSHHIKRAVCIRGAAELRAMAEHPKIQERLPGFKVSMGYGLHAGWAIEVCNCSNNIDCSLEHVYDSLECSPEHARLGTQTPIYSTAHPTRLAAIPLKAQDPKPETRNPKPKTRNPKPKTRNPKTQNPKPLNPKPET